MLFEKQLKTAALNSTSRTKYLHSAGIVYKGSLLSIGTNQDKTHPSMMRFGRNEEAIWLHAEIDAINKFFSRRYLQINLSDCDLLCLRVTKAGHIGLSCPCDGCQEAIRTYGFRKVFYTDPSHPTFWRELNATAQASS
jgi:tRNA(Arg) A34 adenosine deaminase TadA